MNKIVTEIDLFKQNLTLRMNKKEKTSSFLGFLLSLSIMIFLGIYFFSSDIFHKERPITSDQELLIKKREIIDFNKNNFGLVTGISDDVGQTYYDPTIFSFVIVQSKVNNSNSEYYDDYKNFHYCNENDFEANSSILTDMGFEKYFCADNDTMRLAGSWEEETIDYIAIAVRICKNETMNNTCKTPEEIYEFFLDKYISVYYKESNYDLNNYHNPMQESYKNYYWTLSSNMRKVISLFIKKVEIVTDDGIVFQEHNQIDSFKLSEINMDFDLNYKRQLIEIDFYSGAKKQYAIRNYQKIQEVLASMGGIFGFFMSVGFILTKLQIEINIINNVMNKLYSFQTKEKNDEEEINKESEKKIDFFQVVNKVIENKTQNERKFAGTDECLSGLESQRLPEKILKEDSFVLDHISKDFIKDEEIEMQKIKSSKINVDIAFNLKTENLDKKNEFEIENLGNNSARSNILLNSLNVKSKEISIDSPGKRRKSFKIKELEKKMNSNENFKLNFFEYVIFSFKIFFKLKLNFKEKLFQKTKNQFEDEIDITTILQKLHEIEKLKMLILNERQLFMFDYLTKPLIYIENSSNEKKFLRSPSYRMSVMRKSQQKNKNNGLIDYYNETIKNKESSEIDKRIIQFIDQKVENN